MIISLIDTIFKNEGFNIFETEYENINFYSRLSNEKSDYYLTTIISDYESNIEIINNKFEALEKYYEGSNEDRTEEQGTLKDQIIEYGKKNENFIKPQELRKNTSAIYLFELQNIKDLPRYKNIIYNIEESKNYFKRYVLAYTNDQIIELFPSESEIENYNHKILDIVNDDILYEKSLEAKSEGEIYNFVLRLFAKIPFLNFTYDSESEVKELSSYLSEEINKNFDNITLSKLNNIINEKGLSLDSIFNDFDDIKDIDKLIDQEFEIKCRNILEEIYNGLQD